MDKAALRELAEKATPDGWSVGTSPFDQSRHIYGDTPVTDGEDYWLPLIASTDDNEVNIDFEANAAFIAAANPQTILALLAEIQSLTEERTAWRVAAENAEAELKAKYIDCQYAKDTGMTEYKCAGKCQYEALARAVMSDNTGKA